MKKRFALALQNNNECACISDIGCPYGLIMRYLELVPDCQGVERDIAISKSTSTGKQIQPLSFFRALDQSKTVKSFTKGPLGINKMKEAFSYANDRLPDNLKVVDPTGHSGRVSFMNNAKRGGASDLSVCASTHHAVSGKSATGYLNGNERVICTEGALAIGNVIMKELEDSDTTKGIGGYEFDIDVSKDTTLTVGEVEVEVKGKEITIVAPTEPIAAQQTGVSNASSRYVFNFTGNGSTTINNN